jgi:hypothetical protein
MAGPAIVKYPDTIDEKTREALFNIADSFPGVKVIEALPNVDSVQDAEEIPRGTMIMMNANEQLSSELLPEKMFTALGVYKIAAKKSETLRDKQFRIAMQNDFGKKLSAKMGAGPSLKLVEQTEISPSFGKDKEKWSPKLGSGYIGIAKKGEKYSEDYYLVVFTPDTDLSDEILSLAKRMEESDITNGSESLTSFKDLIDSKEYGQCVDLAYRNNARIALEAAKILGVRVAKRIDNNAVFGETDFSRPEIAHRTHYSLWNHLDNGKINISGEERNSSVRTVNIYNKCGSIGESMGGFPIPMSPRLGIQIYPTVQPILNGAQNNYADAVPLGVSWNGTVGLDKPDILFNEKHVFWDNKKGKAVHEKMQRSYNISRDFNFSEFMPEKADHVNLEWVSYYTKA